MGAWPHPLPPTKCGSLESEYRAPPAWDGDDIDERRQPYIGPNVRHARIVQAVYEELPDAQRLVLKAEYPARRTSGRSEGKAAVAQRMNIPVWAYDRHLQAAIDKVGEAFSAVCA